MKTRLKISLGIAVILIAAYILNATSFPFTRKENPLGDSILVKTEWQQMGGFEIYTPDKLRLGCWSTALAQIMYYHKLKPFGHFSYVSNKGYKIDENVDSSSINLDLLVTRMDSATQKEYSDQTARYNYYAALAMQKDFGTDHYMNKLAPSSLLEKHYKAKVNRYISWKGILPYTSGKLEKVIINEISLKRPVFLHFTDLKTFGHSVVVDGYHWKDEKLLVHLNQGQGGPQDGWYDLEKDILVKNDTELRVIYTFEPY